MCALAERRDELRLEGWPSDGSNTEPERWPLTNEEILTAAKKYKIPETAPQEVAAGIAMRDTGHQMTLPGFAPEDASSL